MDTTILMLLFLALIFVMFYFFLLRPQRKRQKEQQEMLSTLKRGDRVVTIGGIYGEVESVADKHVVIKVESGASLKLIRTGVAGTQEQFEQQGQ